jgi:hypothetical protein
VVTCLFFCIALLCFRYREKREREEAGRGGGHVPGEGILKAPQWSSSVRSLGHRSTIWCVQCDPIMLQLLVLQYLFFDRE